MLKLLNSLKSWDLFTVIKPIYRFFLDLGIFLRWGHIEEAQLRLALELSKKEAEEAPPNEARETVWEERLGHGKRRKKRAKTGKNLGKTGKNRETPRKNG